MRSNSASSVRRTYAFAVLALLAASSLSAATRYDPRLRFRLLPTARFNIYYHQGEETQARRLARIAEEVAARLEPRFGRPTRRVHVILVDQSDLSNGWATPVPHNTIEITAAPPRGASLIGNTDDWLRLVFTHEYTHILHLDRSQGLFGGLRKAFGRHPLVYPNLYLPLWQIEGVATYEESASTGRGRLPGGDFREILWRDAAAGRFAPLDRASTLQVDWPSGHTHYVYGGYFHRYLAERFGPESLGRLADATARRVPYLGTPAFKKVFGRSLGALWEDFESAARSDAPLEGGTGNRITRHGFNVAAPRFGPGGHVFYSIANPHGFPALMQVAQTGGEPDQIAMRFLGNRLAIAGDLFVFDELETVRSVGLQSDLFALSLATRDRRRLTREARAADPDIAPGGRTIVCTVQLPDRRALATLPLPAEGRTAVPTLLVSEPQTDFAAPRWSPDGRTIAVERRRVGGASEIVLVSASDGQVRPLVASATARTVDPAWMHDGRTVLFAADRNGSFRIHAVDVATARVRRLDGIEHDAKAPEVSPDGTTLVYVGYTRDGYDLFSTRFDLATWTAVEDFSAPDLEVGPTGTDTPDLKVGPTNTSDLGPILRSGAPGDDSYRPLATLVPQYWSPIVASDNDELTVGVATSSFDVLGRHGYLASAAWSASRGRPDWTAGYVYDRWRPTLFVNFSDDTDPWRAGDVRSREAEAGMVLLFRRVRRTHALFASLHGESDRFSCRPCSPPIDSALNRRSVRAAWHFAGARTYGYSISREEGTNATATFELTRRALGADGNAAAATLDARHYRQLFPRHGVLAARVAAATSWGDEAVARRFTAAGSDPQPGGFGFGSDAIALVRGFHESDAIGPHAAVLNLDYRVPLLRVERGAGTWPVFLRVVHAAVFLDAGQAWDDAFGASDMLASIGAEMSLDTVVGYAAPLTFSAGVAWRVHGPRDRRGVVAFGRIGRAF